MTREFTGASVEYLMPAVSLPADAYPDAPELPTSQDIAVCRSADQRCWESVPDHRGKTAYDTRTRQKQDITEQGKLPDTLTFQPPGTDFDNWDGQQWVTDTAAQHQHAVQQAENQRQSRLQEAERHIAMLERKNRLKMANKRDIELLREWEIYSVRLSEADCTAAPDIVWPETPQST
ncbi:tail fiber assembly protein [Xenorhabdus sp. 12]|uniref:Tail fiber assembly protein n=2 Tax=Xenorhabdus santafensis TaxID=2582833 RepID=A0ABU4SCU0_9GAMM|nr:tail fiber assembly protein [Xenorhabdus sp. 12]